MMEAKERLRRTQDLLAEQASLTEAGSGADAKYANTGDGRHGVEF
jgi:hypothetical protein